ncbi:MAG: alpha-galactosidase [Acidimicrobiales bacterium]|nr:alpha-galactosidase [Acidimicrobiales bacterium]
MHRISNGGTAMVISGGSRMPEVMEWGVSGEVAGGPVVDYEHYRAGLPPATLQYHPPIGLFAQESLGFPGRPGISGHRPDGTGWSPRFVRTEERVQPDGVSFVLEDHRAGLQVIAAVVISDGGAITIDAVLTNVGDTSYTLATMAPTLPLPSAATDLLTLSGRWTMEFMMNRRPFQGQMIVENRRGRTSHENAPVVFAGSAAFNEQAGTVWGAQLAWSGNFAVIAEELSDGRKFFQLGELLLPGEVQLEPGEAYDMPQVIATCSSTGLTPATNRFHAYLRNELRPKELGPRPVNLNVWEAVYFDHDESVLMDLADEAAKIGAERFVLDDGWFGSRRDDSKGLGDWYVSPDVWPNGLTPLIERVIGHGMQFGIWFEPEMVNADSDLFRLHPDWTLTTDGYEPVLGRKQLVLDFGRSEVRENIFDQIDAILSTHDISYVKWDMNRVIVQGSGADGRAGVRKHVLGLYELLDQLRLKHPKVEWESCASGGGRIDAGILAHTDRVWTSDSNDARDRQLIQRGASLLIPPELMGAHIGPPTTHTTGRTHSFGFRAATALFGHFGIEWNVLEMTEDERAGMRDVVNLYKRHRELLHSGQVIRLDHPDNSIVAHGVLAHDGSEGLFSVASIHTRTATSSAPLVIPGLTGTYRVEPLLIGGELPGKDYAPPAWMADGADLPAEFLGNHGLSMPTFWPERALLIHLTRV